MSFIDTVPQGTAALHTVLPDQSSFISGSSMHNAWNSAVVELYGINSGGTPNRESRGMERSGTHSATEGYREAGSATITPPRLVSSPYASEGLLGGSPGGSAPGAPEESKRDVPLSNS